MRKIKQIAIIILVLSLLAACGITKSPQDVLMSELNRIYSSSRQEHMFAFNVEFQFDSQQEVKSEFIRAWLDIMPDSVFRIDGALTLHIGPNEFRLFGSLAAMDEFGEILREYNNNNVDFGVDIYGHKDEGVYYRNRQFYDINRNLGLDYGSDYDRNDYIPIGDADLASELVTLLNNYSNINQHQGFWDGVLLITQTLSEGNSTIINADLNAAEVYDFSQKSTSDWANTARQFFDVTNWNVKYALPRGERLDSTGIYIEYQSTRGENQITKVMPHIKAIITRFAFPLSDDFVIDPR